MANHACSRKCAHLITSLLEAVQSWPRSHSCCCACTSHCWMLCLHEVQGSLKSLAHCCALLCIHVALLNILLTQGTTQGLPAKVWLTAVHYCAFMSHCWMSCFHEVHWGSLSREQQVHLAETGRPAMQLESTVMLSGETETWAKSSRSYEVNANLCWTECSA